MEVLNWFFLEYSAVPQVEKTSIREIRFCPQNRFITLRMSENQEAFNRRNEIAESTGWYFYITGIAIPDSDISRKIDAIPSIHSQDSLNLEYTNEVFSFQKVCSEISCNCFLLTIGGRNILLDASISESPNKYTMLKQIDTIFLSHAHGDHSEKLFLLAQQIPKIPIILSATTLDFFFLKSIKQDPDQYIFTDAEKGLISRRIIVSNGSVLKIVNKNQSKENSDDFLAFYFAGHMPGALMLYAQFKGRKFLYTGDFSYYDYTPIPGVQSILKALPKSLDLLVMDGCSANSVFNPIEDQFKFLEQMVRRVIQKCGNLLIGADSQSTAILIFAYLHKFTIKLQNEEELNNRPFFYLDERIFNYVKVLCTRIQDLHTDYATKIKEELNPFCSGLIRWIRQLSGNEHWNEIEKIIKTTLEQNEYSNVFIFDNSYNSDQSWFLKLLKLISVHEQNSIYLTGAIRSEPLIELISLNKSPIKISGQNLVVKAFIENSLEPDNTFMLHADQAQIIKVVEALEPKNIAFFHIDPQFLIKTRLILAKLPYIEQISAIYKESPFNKKI